MDDQWQYLVARAAIVACNSRGISPAQLVFMPHNRRRLRHLFTLCFVGITQIKGDLLPLPADWCSSHGFQRCPPGPTTSSTVISEIVAAGNNAPFFLALALLDDLRMADTMHYIVLRLLICHPFSFHWLSR